MPRLRGRDARARLRPARRRHGRRLAACGGAPRPAAGAPVWARLEVVENTAEGPAVDRCEIDGVVDERGTRRWRLFYGEVHADSGTDWAPIRARSGCAEIASEEAPDPWVLRGSPYLLVDVALGLAAASAGEVRLEASLTTRRLTGFMRPVVPRPTSRRPNGEFFGFRRTAA